MTVQPLRALQTFWKPGTSRVLTLAILVTLLFFGALFYLYVSQNYSYLVERNFRLLATWSQDLTETLDNYKDSFRFRLQEQKSVSPSPIQSRGVHETLTNDGLVLEGFASHVGSKDTSQKKPPFNLTDRKSVV